MAFPQIVDADTKSDVVTSNSNSWSLTYPTNLVSGDLILAFAAIDADPRPVTWPSGFVDGTVTQGAVTIVKGKKVSDGTETGTLTLGLTTSEQGGWRVFRISGWEGTLGTTFDNASTTGAVTRGSTVGTSASPNPNDHDPINWGVEDTLWILALAVDTSRTVSVYPLPDRNTSNVSGGAGGATLAICTDDLTQSSLNATDFTISASDDWAVSVVPVRPAAAASSTSPFNPIPFYTPKGKSL
jgi:hypothetical protein